MKENVDCECSFSCVFECPKTSPEKIILKADEQKLRQVIQNLIENAIKYTDKGFVKVELKEDKDSVLISVIDSGRGISKELLPNLFKQFSRDSSVKKIQGTGLGLYIAREIIKDHHGKIWAESEGEGKGAMFCVRMWNHLK
jgi:signal transduction histidine kinase